MEFIKNLLKKSVNSDLTSYKTAVLGVTTHILLMIAVMIIVGNAAARGMETVSTVAHIIWVK